MRKPDLFIVGAPRCGTTSMKNYLDKHPEIFMAPGREPHFFGTDVLSSLSIRDEQKYLSLFALAKNEKRVGEKSTWYLYSKRAAAEIKEFQPSARIIVMLRNPVDQIFSHHAFRVHKGYESLVDFEAALEAEEDLRQVLRREVPWSLYRETSRYTHQVKRYLDVFGRANVHIIIFDDFVSQTAKVYRETLGFLRVTPDFQPEFRIINQGGESRVRSMAVQNLLTNRPQFVRSIMKVLMPYQFRERILNRLNYLNSSYAPRPPMKPKLKKQLQEEFLPEVEHLSKLLGRDLTHWCKA